MKSLFKLVLLVTSLIVTTNIWAYDCPGNGQNDGTGSCVYFDGSYPNHPAGSISMRGSQWDLSSKSSSNDYSYYPAELSNWGVVAYGPNNRWASGQNYLSAADAERAAVQICGHKDCWAYSFQGGFGAIAKQTNGRELFAEWSSQSLQKAEAAVMQSCEKVFGKGKCQVVVSSAAQH
ncbi:DUF4189 domain-containing protein [Acinetobacter sp. 1125_18A]|uniref:DUF4189 domain-containing protein n=1 Tax=Acinetobacter sp. 1125_18A TaxID=2605959 RepID=UPI004057EBB0